MSTRTAEYCFDLQLAGGQVVQWVGRDGEDAARRYVGEHPQTTIIAWRWPRYDLVVGPIRIAERPS